MSDFSDRLWSKGFLPIPGEPWTLEDHDKVRVLQDRIAELEAFILSLDCEGYEWCGKSPNIGNGYDGRCAICKKKDKLREVE